MKSDIAIGDRFRMSPLGAARCRRLADKTGTVIGGSIYSSSVSVLFDGNKSPSRLHRDYIELISPKQDRSTDPKA
jgi:hypothetical protein